MKVVYTGLESSGKSYLLADRFEKCRIRNFHWYQKYGIVRTMAPNFPLNEEYEEIVRNTPGVELRYWRDIDEAVTIEGADVFIDEMILYFDARKWPDLSDASKRWITQSAKMGNHIYGACQDFSQVDKSFRLLTNQLYMVIKIIGNKRPGLNLPPLQPLFGIFSEVWGFGRIRAMNPLQFDDELKKFESESIFTIRFFRFREKITRLFDTNLKLKVSNIIKKKHMMEQCDIVGCKLNHYVHR